MDKSQASILLKKKKKKLKQTNIKVKKSTTWEEVKIMANANW